MIATGFGDGQGRGARRGLVLVTVCACALAAASCSEDVVRGNGIKSALGGGSPDAAAPTPSSLQAAPPANQQATWTNLWGSWPAGRYQHAAAYDSDRKIMVMYGGQGTNNVDYYGDTWEWNDARGSWVQRANNGSNVGTRSGHQMVYDQAAKKVFLFGGWQPAASFYIPGQWYWDPVGSGWNARATSMPEPDPRHDHAMVYDSDRAKIVLFGGMGGPGTDAGNKARENDVWEWDSAALVWSQPTITGVKPVPRFGHTMVYDSARKRIVVRGGNTGTGAGAWVNETWELDPATWTWKQLVTTGTAPPYYSYGGYDRLVYDASRGKVVLFEYQDAIFELDPTTPTWNKIVATRADTTGPAYGYVATVYDPLRATIILFAGQNARPRDLWELDGANLTLTNRSVPTSGPVQRQFPSLAYDSKRGKLMLFGGYNSADGASAYKQDIFEWSGTDANWIGRTTLDTKPTPRYQAAMTYDSKRDRLLLFGGVSSTSFDDLWQWSPTTQTWSQITFAASGTRPTGRSNLWLFYDAARDKVLAFGYSGTPNEIWEYDPALNTWKNRTPMPFPAGISRSYADVTFDSDRGKVVMVGGYVSPRYTTDIWEWDTTTGIWEQRMPAAGTTVPVGRYYHAVSYDSGRRVVLMFGGYGSDTGLSTPINDSWEWDSRSSTWTETTPSSVVPLPRYNHLLAYDSKGGSTYLFGGTVNADPTYGPQEIWQYFANSTPRPNGSSCSAATASTCMSGNCIDGVCCAQATCAGTCKSCANPGSEGTCSDVTAGLPDDSCAGDQACNAAHACKSRNGQTCGSIGDCASGRCVDSVCCATDCTETCKACNLTGSRGTCTNLPTGLEDPVAAPTCVSDASQPRYCDGGGVCTNAAKPNGRPCTAGGQCASTFCIDGVCCGTACNQACYACNGVTPGTCTPLAAGLQDHSATQPCDSQMQYCASGSCLTNKKPNGGTCTVAADCGSSLCVDGYCCNSACTGTCQACNVAGKQGSCVNLPAGQPDNNATVACGLPQYCDAAGTCQSGLKANGIPCTGGAAGNGQCGSGFCVDGYCCDQICNDTCRACNLPNQEGTCNLVSPGGTDATATTACTSPNYCAGGGACTMGRKPNGSSCVLGNECGSNNCVDGTCCENSCTGPCLSCKNATGSCVLAAVGTDLRKNCGAGDCAGACDGQGGCTYPASGKMCGTAGCASDGVIHKPGMCDGAGKCANDVLESCNGFKCFHDANDNMDKCATSCANDPNCQIPFFCDDTQHCPADYDNGHVCQRDAQCSSNHCAIAPGDTNGVCCDRDCRSCGTCNLPGTVGTCVPTPAGTDPHHDCIDSASDPGGKCGGTCNGQWGCEFPPVGTTCGTCKQCDGASKCTVKPDDDDTCGVIDCDMLDTTCTDYRDLTKNRCGSLGACKAANTTTACTDLLVTCQPDAGGDAGMSLPDGAAADTGGATDAATTPPKGGGGCGCAVGTRGGAQGDTSNLALLLGFGAVAGVIGAGRRRRGRR